MKRTNRMLLGNPFQAWTDLAWKIGEMSMASAQVIAHRTTRMAISGPLPSTRDRQEFSRMGQEKVEAATQSAQAIAAQMAALSGTIGTRAFSHWMSGSAALMSLAASRSVGQFVTRQAKLAQAMSRSANTAFELADSTARLAGHGLKPIHARATANARRLGKR